MPFIPSMSSILLFIFLVSFQRAVAVVPAAKTFRITNRGSFQRYTAEYSSNFRALPFAAFPFRLCFYNTTPNAFTLAVGMGDIKLEQGIKWVWDANRGRPVKENAVLSFGPDGNLVLTDTDGSIAWQSGTANKGVAGINLLSTGNLVLVNEKGTVVWQSFDFPGDTLVPGQYLSYKEPNKLTGRVSAMNGSPGPYSFQITPTYWGVYYTVKGKSLRYYREDSSYGNDFNVTVTVIDDVEERDRVSFAGAVVAYPNYNATYSIARMGSDGNIYLFTFTEKVKRLPWEKITQFFLTDDSYVQPFCRLPERCGKLGVCQGDQCVACPQPQGLVGWSPSCSPPTPACGGGAVAKYYRVVGVDQFLSLFGDGERAGGLEDCRGKCSKDCGCLGFSYNQTSSRCFTTPYIGNLFVAEDQNPTHVFYIKT